jgi:hypothetical protein
MITKFRLSCDPDDRSGEMKIQPGAASQAANMAPTGETLNAGAAFQDALTTSKKAMKPASRSLASTNMRRLSRLSPDSLAVGKEDLSAGSSQASLVAANLLGADAGMRSRVGGAYQAGMQRAARRNEQRKSLCQFLLEVAHNSASVTKKSIEGMHV